MKIALAFFGLPRCSSLTFPSIAHNLIAPLQAAGELRVFYHLYRQEWVFNPRSGENHALDPGNYAFFRHHEGRTEPLPEQASPLFDRLKAHGDAWNDGFRSLRNLLLQLQSLYEVTQRVAATEPDVVMFARPDLLYHDALRPDHVAWAAAHPDAVTLPWWESWGGFNDRFALCGCAAYRAYGGRLLLADQYCASTGLPLHSETFLRHALAFAGIAVRPFGLRATRIRVDGHAEWEDFEGVRSPLATSYAAG